MQFKCHSCHQIIKSTNNVHICSFNITKGWLYKCCKYMQTSKVVAVYSPFYKYHNFVDITIRHY